MPRRSNRNSRRNSQGRSSRRTSRDYRNPYGSQGGYVRSSDYARRSDRENSQEYDNAYRGTYRDMPYNNAYDYNREYRNEPYRSQNQNQMRYEQNRDYEYDYARFSDKSHSPFLQEQDIKEWKEDLMEMLSDNEKQMLSKESVLSKAREKNIKFEDYTEDELYLTTLMVFSDYKNTLGGNSLDVYVSLAKDFLEDKDSELSGGEKLSAYYEYVVCGE